MTKLKALIFDVDGTMAETEKNGHRIAFNSAFAAAKLDWHWSVNFYGELLAISGGKERIRFYIEQYKSAELPKEDLTNFITTLHLAKTKYYRQLLEEGAIPLRLGVERLIREAREQGILLAIATTSALPNAMALLEKFFNPDWFEVIAAGDIVPAKKPAPDIYNYVLQQMNLQPSDCIVLEDSYHGLEAATAAGLTTIVTVNDYTKNQDFSNALLVLNHLGEPEQPFEIIQGQIQDVSYLDLNIIDNLLSAIEN